MAIMAAEREIPRRERRAEISGSLTAPDISQGLRRVRAHGLKSVDATSQHIAELIEVHAGKRRMACRLIGAANPIGCMGSRRLRAELQHGIAETKQ